MIVFQLLQSKVFEVGDGFCGIFSQMYLFGEVFKFFIEGNERSVCSGKVFRGMFKEQFKCLGVQFYFKLMVIFFDRYLVVMFGLFLYKG